MQLQVAQLVPCTEAEGPGKRFAIWVQGCPLRCSGCCNPEYLPFAGGTAWAVADLLALIEATHQREGIEGVTLLGGEPTVHAATGPLASGVQRLGLSVMVFSGYTLAQLHQRAQAEPALAELLAQTDILVDGPYLRDQPDTRRRWIGSTNQTIHFLTPRYRADDPCWQQPNTLEIRLDRDGVTINGFPAAQAAGLWKGLTRKRGRGQ
jgi:anaerobic ribonucleoside-triphosphate reductase activating protein